MGIRTQKPLPKGPAEGGARGEGLLGPYAHSRGLRDRTGPFGLGEVPSRRRCRGDPEPLATAGRRGLASHLGLGRAESELAIPGPNRGLIGA